MNFQPCLLSRIVYSSQTMMLFLQSARLTDYITSLWCWLHMSRHVFADHNGMTVQCTPIVVLYLGETEGL